MLVDVAYRGPWEDREPRDDDRTYRPRSSLYLDDLGFRRFTRERGKAQHCDAGPFAPQRADGAGSSHPSPSRACAVRGLEMGEGPLRGQSRRA